MPFFSFYLAEDLRGYSSTRAVEASSIEAAQRRVQEMLTRGELDDLSIDPDFGSGNGREIVMDERCQEDEYEVVGSGTLEPDTQSRAMVLRPPVAVVEGLAILAQREKEIGNEG